MWNEDGKERNGGKKNKTNKNKIKIIPDTMEIQIYVRHAREGKTQLLLAPKNGSKGSTRQMIYT